jgi:positive regulator of sigma E activity
LIRLSQAGSTELAAVDVVLVARPNGGYDLQAEQSATCKACRLCGSASSYESAAGGEHTTRLSLSLPGRTLALVAIGLYGAPLAGLLAGALLAAALGAQDIGALAGSIAGFSGAALLIRAGAGRLERLTAEQLKYRSRAPVGPP